MIDKLENYKFDKSGYIQLDDGLMRVHKKDWDAMKQEVQRLREDNRLARFFEYHDPLEYAEVVANYIRNKENNIHEGDCTKVAHTCWICMAETYEADLKQALQEITNKE